MNFRMPDTFFWPVGVPHVEEHMIPLGREVTVRFYVSESRFIEVDFEEDASRINVRSNQPIFCHQGRTSKELRITSLPEDFTYNTSDDPRRKK